MILNFFQIIFLFIISTTPVLADNFSDALSKAGELYGAGNISAAHYWYLEANKYATSKEQLRKTLPALAVTAIKLGRVDENLQYLREYQRISPNNTWINQHVKEFSITLPANFYEVKTAPKPLIIIITLVAVIFFIANTNKKNKPKKRFKNKKYLSTLPSFIFSAFKTASRVRHLMTVASNKPPVFISYSRQDIKFLNELKEHLTVYERRGLIEYWDDSKIQMGMLWRLEIKQALNSAKIAILLVSRPYLASKFIVNNELPPLLRSAKEHNTEIIPVMVSPCPYDISEIGKIQASNSLLKPLKDLSPSERDIEYLRVLDRVAELLQE